MAPIACDSSPSARVGPRRPPPVSWSRATRRSASSPSRSLRQPPSSPSRTSLASCGGTKPRPKLLGGRTGVAGAADLEHAVLQMSQRVGAVRTVVAETRPELSGLTRRYLRAAAESEKGVGLRAHRRQGPQERRDDVLPHRGRVGDAAVRQERDVPAQVAAVGLQRVVREPPLHDEVVEVRADGALERGGPGRGPTPLRSGPGQARAPSSDVCSMPWASATGALVSLPAWVLRPRASDGSSCSAFCQPWSASATV